MCGNNFTKHPFMSRFSIRLIPSGRGIDFPFSGGFGLETIRCGVLRNTADAVIVATTPAEDNHTINMLQICNFAFRWLEMRGFRHTLQTILFTVGCPSISSCFTKDWIPSFVLIIIISCQLHNKQNSRREDDSYDLESNNDTDFKIIQRDTGNSNWQLDFTNTMKKQRR